MQEIADEKGFTVQLFECGESDHVHCFVTAPPKLSVTMIVKYLKGITGRKLFEQFPEIRTKLWICCELLQKIQRNLSYPVSIEKIEKVIADYEKKCIMKNCSMNMCRQQMNMEKRHIGLELVTCL